MRFNAGPTNDFPKIVNIDKSVVSYQFVLIGHGAVCHSP